MAYSFSALEFERLKNLLARYVSSEDARSAIADIAPSTEYHGIGIRTRTDSGGDGVSPREPHSIP